MRVEEKKGSKQRKCREEEKEKKKRKKENVAKVSYQKWTINTRMLKEK
ncbi:MAG: hypothetical protein JNK70_14235 [Phycisphaerae bacterium]|nr:hypothetical protein [Phycisphaerae bacterium]